MRKALAAVSLVLVIVFLFSLTGVAGAQDEEEQEQEREQVVAEKKEEPALGSFNLFYGVDLGAVNETQMALLMVNRHIEYLIGQNEEKNKQMADLSAQYQKNIEKEINRQQELRDDHRTEIELLQKKLEEKDAEIGAVQAEVNKAQAEIHRMEKNIAIYIGESGLYLKMLVALIAGVLLGFILASISGWRQKKKSDSAAL
jgi:predicted RNase H-like nuclease (RuvC/YqgF family)